MTSEDIQDIISIIEDQVLRLEQKVADEEFRITKCDMVISQKETAMTRTNSSTMQSSYARAIASEKKKKLQYSKNRDNFKKQLNQKRNLLLQAQRLVPDKDINNEIENFSMESVNPEDKIYQIFISSTYNDLVHERDKAMRTIVGMGHLPIGMEDFPATDIEAFEYIKKMIDKADYYLLIIGGKYGSEHPVLKKSYTELEFDYAVSKNIPVIFLLKEGIKDIDYLDVDPLVKGKLDAFITKASTGRLRVGFTNVDQLAVKLEHSLTSIIRDIPRPGWVRADSIAHTSQPTYEEPDFDFNTTLTITYHPTVDPFEVEKSSEDVIEETKVVTWAEIIKELGGILVAPTSIFHIKEILCGLAGGIDDVDANKILDTLVHLNILEVGTTTNEYTGVESYCSWTKKGYEIKAKLSVSADMEYSQRDLRTISDLMSHFSTNLMDDYFRNGPEYIYDKMLISHDYWSYTINASAFMIYDTNLRDKLIGFFNQWTELMRHSEWYSPSESNTKRYRFFGLKHDLFENRMAEDNFNHLHKTMMDAIPLYSDFIKYVKTTFKLDLVVLSHQFETTK